MNITLNITEPDGTLLGQVRLTTSELRAARISPVGASALVEEICVEAGIG